jgi:thiol-disulfide isomerase/thioredoxin
MSGFMLVSYVALWVLVAVMAVLLVLLYRHFGMMSLGTLEGVQRDGLPVGSVAPTISGITADGADKGWDPKTGRYQLLLFAAPDCEPCATVMPHVNRLGRSRDAGVDVAAIVPGPKSEAVRMVNRYDPPFTTLAEDGSGAFGRFRVRVTPFGFIIGPDGRILAKGTLRRHRPARQPAARGRTEGCRLALAGDGPTDDAGNEQRRRHRAVEDVTTRDEQVRSGERGADAGKRRHTGHVGEGRVRWHW